MPNWVNHKINIYSTKEENINNFLAAIGNPNMLDEDERFIDFNKLIPQPQFENDSDWYDWNYANWGTKWNACHAELSDLEGFFSGMQRTLTFDTAWCPCTPIIDKLYNLAEQFDCALDMILEEESGAYKIFLDDNGQGTIWRPSEFSLSDLMADYKSCNA